MKGTIVITGGSGFIGTHLIDLLEGHADLRIVNLDAKPPQKKEHQPYWIKGDIMDPAGLQKIFQDLQPRYVAHLAARTDTDGKTVEEYPMNHIGTQNMVDVIRESPSVERTVFVSTQYVVGPGPLPADEFDFRPHTIYGQSKVLSEKAIRAGNLESVWTIVRPTNVWGSWHPRYPREFWRVLDKGLYFHPGTKQVMRSYGYVGNVVAQMAGIFEKPAEMVNHKVFYVGDEPVDVFKWADTFSVHLTGHRARVIPQGAIRVLALAGDGLRKIGVKFPIYSSRLQSMTQDYLTPMEPTFALLGPPPKSMEDGVKETVAWLRLTNAHR